jgi:peroxiredoxin Q/BCP
VLLGITFSPTEDLKRWRDEVGMTTELLCDTDRSVAVAYGAADSKDQERPKRISVLVGPDGKVVKTYGTPDAEAHSEEVLADLMK